MRSLSDSPLRFFYFSDFDIRDRKNVGRRELDKTESKKKINELSIIKKRRKRRGTNQNSKTQGGCSQIQWHVFFITSIKKNSVQDNERKHETMLKKKLSRSRAWVLSEGQPVKPK